MRHFFSRGALPWVAVLGLTQAMGGSAHADWFEAYEADVAAESSAAPGPQELEPSIAAALDADLEHLTFADHIAVANEDDASDDSSIEVTSFVKSVASTFNPPSCDNVSCTSTGGRFGRLAGKLPPWRPYISGISGVTFATLDDDSVSSPAIRNESVFTIGGAVGMAFERSNGALRLEIEGRARDQMTATETDPQFGSLTLRATDVWSATINAWRDYQVFDSLGIYAGGGLGTGGYRSTLSGTGLADLYTGNDPVANFAWQAGGGVIYELNPRITFDVGYRFFAIDETPAVGFFAGQPFTYNERYSASELLLTVRVYEPFRRWR